MKIVSWSSECRHWLCMVLLYTVFFRTVPTLPAANLVWTNALGGDWNNAANWSPNQVPGPSDNGTLSLNVNVTNSSPSTVSNFTFTGGTLRGSGPLTVSGTMNWIGGSIASGSTLTIASNGVLNLTNNFTRDLPGATLNNAGTVVWADGQIRGGNDTVINNSGLWRAQSDDAFTGNTFGGSSSFTNSGTFRKSVTAGLTTLNSVSFHNTGTVDVQTGTVNLGGGLTGHGNFSGAGSVQLNGIVNATVNGTLNWSGGSIGNSSILNLNGTVTWSGGGIATGSIMNVASNAVLTITNSTHDLNGAKLNNAGTVVWAGGQIRGGDNAAINNSGLWHCQSDDAFNGNTFGGSSSFTNSGTFRKSVTTGSTTLSAVSFHNTGTVDVQAGTVSFGSGFAGNGIFSGAGAIQLSGTVNATINGVMNWSGGSISSGSTLNVASNATLNLITTTHDLPGSVLNNAGTVVWIAGQIRGGTGTAINNSGLWLVQTDNTISAAFSGTVAFNNSGTFRRSLTSGTTAISSGVAFNSTGIVDVQAGTITFDGGLTGSGSYSGAGFVQLGGIVNATVGGTMNWSGGSISSGSILAIATNGILNIVSSTHDIPGTALNNSGTVVWLAGQIRGGTGTAVNNAGLWRVESDNVFNAAFSGTAVFSNSGTFRKSVTAGTTTFQSGVTFNSTGTVDSQTGTLGFDGGLSGIGNYTGSGTILMSGAVNVTMTGTMNWGGGSMTSGSVLNVTTNSILNIISSTHDMPGTELNNSGTVVWTGGQIRTGTGGVINNSGLWLAQVANSINTAFGGTATFTNSGTFRKWVTGGATTLQIGIAFWNSGTTEVQTGSLSLDGSAIQTDGITRLNGGSLALGQPFQLLGGLLTGSNTITGTVTNNSIVKPGGDGPGLLTISGGYIQTANGRLDIQIGATNVASGYDRLAVSGSINLNGRLDVTLIDPFIPAVSNTFRIATFGSRTGDFSEVNGLVIQTNLALLANYTVNALDLVAVSTNQPATLPVITSQPQSQTIINGQSAAFNVTATGTRPFHYQWQLNETDLSGANTLNLTLINAQTNQAGNYRVIITNSAGSATSQVAVLTVKPVADLVITDIGHPTNAFAAQPVTFTWHSLNQGSQSALAPWTETIGLSTNAGGVPSTIVATITALTNLISGQSVMRTQAVILPGGLEGTFYAVLHTDTGNQVVEEDNETNNVTVSSVPMTIHSPDLRPVSVIAPAAAQFGQTISASWIVTNSGAAPVFSSWSDRIHLSASSNSLSGATLLTTFAVTNIPLASAATVSNNANLTLPLAPGLSAGGYFLVVSADYANAIAETNENNNLLSAPISLSLPPLPDLSPFNIIAPTNVLPGQSLPILWALTNRGSLSITGAWSETVYLATNNTGGGSIELGTFVFTNTLNAGSALSRTQTVAVPIASPLGSVWFLVETDSRDDVFESSETNNLAAATNSTLIPAVLTLALSAAQITEGAAQPLQAIVTRNGSRSQPLTVTLTNGDPTEISIPANVVILAGQASAAFNVSALADGIVDGSQAVNITAAAIGFADAMAQVTVLDADRPNLSISLATNVVREGLTLPVTVSRDAGTNNAVVINITSSSPGQLLTPDSVTINPGSYSSNFAILAVDDFAVEADATYTVTVTATNHNGDSTNVTVLDDDLPTVDLSFATTNISENAGPQATIGTIQRTPVTTAPLYLELESDNTNALLAPSLVTIPSSQSNVSFAVAAVNNNLLDGPKTVEVRVWVKTSPAGARVDEGKPATLTVNDDEGPALHLSVAQSLVPEGANPATTATVSRNTGTNGSLLVNLASSDTGEATVPASVNIPVGATSASVNVATPTDGVSDGSKSVVLTASASGFAPATTQLTVSDVNQPDLVVQSVVAPTNAETEAFVNLGYQIRNQGFGAMSSNTISQRIYLSSDPLAGGDTLMGQYTFSGGLPVGAQFGQTFANRLPLAAGDYWVVVETDVSNVVSEILEDNNARVSSVPIHVSAAYAAEVSTSLQSAPANTPVPLTGHAFRPANNAPVPFVLVNIHLNVRGTHRVISALTDVAGNFATTWQPLPGEAGSYEIGAAHPGFTNAPTQDSFALYGMNAIPSSPSLTLMGQGSVTGVVEIVNAGDLPLNAVAAQVLSPPANLNFAISLATNSIAGLGTNALNYTINSTDGLAASGVVVVRLTSAEGATLDVPFAVTVETLTPRLVAIPSQLVRGMKRGTQTFASFGVTNNGGAASGPITVSLPVLSWLSLTSTNPLPSLAPGEGTSVTLQLMPPSDLPLTTVSGNVLLSAAGNVAAVPFEFRALSESKGDLRVTASDEFTYYAVGAPKLTNAVTILRDAVSATLITNGVTGTNGEWFVAQLPEGYYELEVTADKHTAYKSTFLLLAGVTNDIGAFLSRQTVRYTWTVVPTEIEDRYRIVVETEFEANVPAPVVTIEPSVIDLEDMEDEMQVDLKIENHGLIAAEDFELQFDEHPGVRFEPLISRLGTLPAKSTFTVPLMIRRVAASTAARNKSLIERIGSCFATGRGVDHFKCGPFFNVQVTTITFPNAGDCLPAIPLPSFSWLPSGGGVSIGPVLCDCVPPPPPRVFSGFYSTNGGGGSHFVDLLLAAIYQATPALAIPNPCDPECLPKLGEALLKCREIDDGGPDPCPQGLGECLPPLLINPSDETVINCMAAGLTCWFNYAKKAPIISCLFEVLEACAPEDEERGTPLHKGEGLRTFTGPYAGLLGTLQTRVDRIVAVNDHYNYFLGDAAWRDTDDQNLVRAFYGQFNATIAPGSDAGTTISAGELAALLSQPLPSGVTAVHVNHSVERWNRSVSYWQAGIFTLAQVPTGNSTDFLALDELNRVTVLATNAIHQSQSEGFASLEAGANAAVSELVDTISAASGGTCAKVKLRLNQDAVLSRDAFKATLEIDNSEGNPLENLYVTLGVVDAAGNDASALFGIQPPQLTGISGTNGNGTLPTDQTGKFTWTLVPTVDAAPTNATEYFVSGGLNYVVNSNVVSIPLSPAPITVHPVPRLTVKYFHQRDVFSDDPFTDVIEPAIPFSLGVMVQNTGQGTAKNFRITSAQPEIVENEKGLLIDFKIIATEVAGKNLQPTLTADLGDIAPNTNAIARWLLTSTLQGLFIDYNATFEHVDGLGIPKLSLIDEVQIHEMIHVVQAGGVFEDGRPDFLVNDVPDIRDYPDTLYLSNGSTNPVQVLTNGVVTGTLSPGNLQVQLDAPMPGGWVYLRVPDPANGQYHLIGVVRSDSFVIGVETNAWVTDRTFRGLGKRPIRENILHLLDYNSTGTYTLIYELNPALDLTSPSSAVTALPAESSAAIPLNWSGQDEIGGSEIAFYDIYVSDNGGAFQRWLANAANTSAIYPGVLGHGYAFYSAAVDHSGNRENAPASPDAQTTVTRTNRAPVIEAITNRTLIEGQTLLVTVVASDPDGDGLSFALGLGAPQGVVLNAQSGLLTWATGEGHGPSTNVVTVIARDNGIPQLNVSQSFNVVVLEDNLPPVLAPIANENISEGELLTITNVAFDPDLPTQQLTFSLAAGAPAGAAINPTNGVFAWTPSSFQGGVTNVIAVIVTDNGQPSLGATQLFAVVVLDSSPDFDLSIGTAPVLSGGSTNVALTLNSGADLTNITAVIEITGDRLTNLNLQSLAPGVASAELFGLGSNRYDLRFHSQAGSVLQGNLTLARLAFDTVSNDHSAVVKLTGISLTGQRMSQLPLSVGRVNGGRVFVIGLEPVLDAWAATNQQLVLVLYAQPGMDYGLERRSGLAVSNAWMFAGALNASGLRTELSPRPMSGAMEFFRAYQLVVGELSVRQQSGQLIIEWPLDCGVCLLEETTGLGPGAVWTRNSAQPQIVGDRYRVTLPIGAARSFYRLVAPSSP